MDGGFIQEQTAKGVIYEYVDVDQVQQRRKDSDMLSEGQQQSNNFVSVLSYRGQTMLRNSNTDSNQIIMSGFFNPDLSMAEELKVSESLIENTNQTPGYIEVPPSTLLAQPDASHAILSDQGDLVPLVKHDI